MKPPKSITPAVTKTFILIAIAYALFLAIAFLPGCASQKTGCHSVAGKNYKVGY